MCCRYLLHIKDYVVFSYLDYVSVMTYDYYGAWDNVTGINAPLYGRNYLEEDDDGHWKNVVSYDDDDKFRLYHWISVC
jgi:GH18 family chitinase